ncbi:MAG: hypothetical protein LBF40_04020 [Deltaproteobacteria bacterium]|nr:hypothetical protein [Deltaproteobacteria bacterium]
MNSTDEKLKAICAEISNLSENELMALLPKYHRRLEDFQNIREWEEATIAFFIINGIRIKNIQLPQKIGQLCQKAVLPKLGRKDPKDSQPNTPKPSLRLVK